MPAALLKQGYAFANLGEKGNARLILKELIRKYPGTSEAKIAAEKLDIAEIETLAGGGFNAASVGSPAFSDGRMGR